LVALRCKTVSGNRDYSKSRRLEIQLPDNLTENEAGVGWEMTKNGQKPAQRKIDLSASMDPNLLASNAVDLNLKLMKWRLQPNIDLEIVKNKKVLLLGSGTLGCNVSRVLIGWGCRHITFVDNGVVSFSNPVRQSLFTFQDSVDRRAKSEAAAEAIKLIAPMVNTQHKQLSIPMPGHYIELDELKSSVSEVDELISTHDIIYLLMDTRESRWLPTLLGKIHNKIVINAALGFDTFMVMRHGMCTDKSNEKNKFYSLGCYFCNDVVAPTNSTTDRTLDQQCTVSRPGLSLIASSYAVELMVSILQHKDGPYAPSFLDPETQDEEAECCLGPIPHQIRGFLGHFHTIRPTTQSFPQCTACSDCVLDAYRNDKFDFLVNVFTSSGADYLEELTGLAAMKNIDECDVIELSDDDF